MCLLIVASNQDNLKNILGLSKAAINNGYNVTMFLNEGSILLLKNPSSLEQLDAEIIVC
jgi:hypothetical protein